MAIDWSRTIVVEDEKTTQILCGKEIMHVRGHQGYPGRGITDISKTSTAGNVDTYTITYSDGTTSTFTVTNGSGGGDASKVYLFNVDAENGSDENDGSVSAPFKTLQHAIDSVPIGHIGDITLMTEGSYGDVAIENRIISIHMNDENIVLGEIEVSKSYLFISSENRFETKEMNFIDSDVRLDSDVFVKSNFADYAITINNSVFISERNIKFQLTNQLGHYAVKAQYASRVYLYNLSFVGIITTALLASSGSTICYTLMTGDDFILNRESCEQGGYVYHIAPNQPHSYYVDGENGDDSDTGYFETSAFKTLQQAVDLIPNNCHSTITLIGGNCGNATIENKDITINVIANGISIGKLTLNNSDVKIDNQNHVLQVSTSEQDAIVLNHSRLSVNYDIAFELTDPLYRYAVTAEKLSHANFRNIRFVGDVTTALLAKSGSTICYLGISGNGDILHRELCESGGYVYRFAPNQAHTYYIDGENGNDSNSGTSDSSPFQNMQTAVNLIPNDCYSTIVLMNGDCGGANISNKKIFIDVLEDDISIGHLNLINSDVEISNINHLLTVSTDAEHAIDLHDSLFSVADNIAFEMTSNVMRIAVFAENASHAYLSRIYCNSTINTAIYATRGAIVSYVSINGTGSVLHREYEEFGARIFTGSRDSFDTDIFASEFNSSDTYYVGDYVVYENDLYRCKAYRSPGDWNAEYWQKVSVSDELKLKASKFDTQLALQELEDNKVDYTNIAPIFDGSDTRYNVGDYVIHEGKLYRFITYHPIGAWSSSEVEEVSTISEFIDSKADKTIIAPIFDNSRAYDIGDFVIHGNKLYKFITGHQVGEWDSSEVEELTVSELLGEGAKNINSIELTASNKSYNTYTITFTDNSTLDFNISNQIFVEDVTQHKFEQKLLKYYYDNNFDVYSYANYYIINKSRIKFDNRNNFFIRHPLQEDFKTYSAYGGGTTRRDPPLKPIYKISCLWEYSSNYLTTPIPHEWADQINYRIYNDGSFSISRSEPWAFTSRTGFLMYQVYLKPGHYKISGGVKFVSTVDPNTWYTGVKIRILNNDSDMGTLVNATDEGEGAEFTISEYTFARVFVDVDRLSNNGFPYDQKFYPMLTIADYGTSEYLEPHAWHKTWDLGKQNSLYCFDYNPFTGVLLNYFGVIQSYNGEDLPGKWYVDYDIYYRTQEKPNLGNKVIYELAEPEIIQGENIMLTKYGSFPIEYGYGAFILWDRFDNNLTYDTNHAIEIISKDKTYTVNILDYIQNNYYAKSEVYTKSESDDALELKANKADVENDLAEKAPIIIADGTATYHGASIFIPKGVTINNMVITFKPLQEGSGTPAFDNPRRFLAYKGYSCSAFYKDHVISWKSFSDTFKNTNLSYGEVDNVIFGGSYNLLTDELTITHGFIASYNREPLPDGKWIGTMSVSDPVDPEYNRPVLGDQIVYELDEPIVIPQNHATPLKTLPITEEYDIPYKVEADIVAYFGKISKTSQNLDGNFAVSGIVKYDTKQYVDERADPTTIAQPFDEYGTYEVGDLVTKMEKLYRLTVKGVLNKFVSLNPIEITPSGEVELNEGEVAYLTYDGVLYRTVDGIAGFSWNKDTAELARDYLLLEREVITPVSVSTYNPSATYYDGDIVVEDSIYYKYDVDGQNGNRWQMEQVTVGEMFGDFQDKIDNIEARISRTITKTSDTHWMRVDNSSKDQIFTSILYGYNMSLTGISWLEIYIKNRNLIENYFMYRGISGGYVYNGVRFTQNSDDSISFIGTPTEDITLQVGLLAGLPVGQYYLSGGVNANCYLYISGTEIKSTGNDTLFTANAYVNQLVINLSITNTGEEVSGTFYPMIRFKDDDGTYIKPEYRRSLSERLGNESNPKPLYGGKYNFVTAKIVETCAHIDNYQHDPSPLPGRFIADNYDGDEPAEGASVTYELAKPVVREESTRFTECHLCDDITYLFANNANAKIVYLEAKSYIISQVENLQTSKADTSAVYTKTETDSFIDDLQDQIDNINSFSTHICVSGEYNPSTLVPTIANPDASTFYLVPSGSGNDMYDEWVYVNSAWEKFGSARIDLTSYYTKTETDALLSSKANSVDVYSKTATDNLLAAKQNTLTFDSTPTASSTNPVKSGGVKTAIDNLQNQIDDIVTTGGGIPEAPQDGKMYVRKDGQWVSIEFK